MMRTRLIRSFAVIAVAALSLLAAACGHGSSSPSSPSASASAPMPGPAAGAVSGAVISGTVVGVAGASQFTARGVVLTVTVTGSSATSTVDASGHFTLMNVPAGHVDLHFVGAGTDAHLGLDNVADHQTITITVRVTGSSAQLDTEDSEDEGDTEIEGLVTSVNATSVTVDGKTITINAATQIVHGDTVLTLASLQVGDRIHVKAATSATGIIATRIEVQNTVTPPAPTPPPGEGGDDGKGNGNEVEVDGTIATKGGACPALSLTIGSTKVATDASTSFKGASCTALALGTKVEVKGSKQADGSVVASRIQTDD
jgi:hypothetical protein